MNFLTGSMRIAILLIASIGSALAAEEMQTRVFKIPPDFIGHADDVQPPDPFALKPLPPRRPDTSKSVLESAGVAFPTGATSSFEPVSYLLTVHNTPPNLDLVEDFVDSLNKYGPKAVVWNLIILEGPAEIIGTASDQASQSASALAQLESLLALTKKPDSPIHILADAYIEGKSSTNIAHTAATDHSFTLAPELDAKGRSSVPFETRTSGIQFEMGAVISPDGMTIEANLAIHAPAPPPTSRQTSVTDPITGNPAEYPITDIPVADFVTSITLKNGHTRLVGVAKSTRGKDRLQAAFLTANVRSGDPQERYSLFQPPPPSLVTPPGMTALMLSPPPGTIDSAMPGRPHQSLLSWLKTPGITAPGSSATRQGNQILVITTPENMERIALVVDHLINHQPNDIHLTLHTIQAQASLLRDLARQAATTKDHAAILAVLEAAVAKGEAHFIDTAFVEAESGTSVSHAATSEHTFLSEFATTDQGRPEIGLESRKAGSIIEFEGHHYFGSSTIEANISYELHSAAPTAHRAHFLDPQSKKRFELPLLDFHVIKTTTGITLGNGLVSLLSLQKPPGRDIGDHLWATFVRADVVYQVTPPRPPAPKPIKLSRPPPSDPDALEVQTFHVPPDFLTVSGKTTAEEVLKDIGITFPKSATASFRPATLQLFVRNTRANLDLVEAFVSTQLVPEVRSVAITSHIIQAPGPLLRQLAAQAATRSNHESLFAALLANKEATQLDLTRLEGKGGARLTVAQGTEVSYLKNITFNDKGIPVLDQQTCQTGLHFEMEPSIESDFTMLNLLIAPTFHTAPPTEHREHLIDTTGRRVELPLTDFHTFTTSATLTIPDGTTHLVSLWKPVTSSEDVLQALFITAHVLPHGQ